MMAHTVNQHGPSAKKDLQWYGKNPVFPHKTLEEESTRPLHIFIQYLFIQGQRVPPLRRVLNSSHWSQKAVLATSTSNFPLHLCCWTDTVNFCFVALLPLQICYGRQTVNSYILLFLDPNFKTVALLTEQWNCILKA